MGRKKARNLDQLPIDVHVTEQWSDDSVIALYNSPSRDPNRRFAAVGSLSGDSEYGTADSESFNSYHETKKQTKFLEELLNYTDSVSLDSEGNELGPHGDSSDSYSDWDSRVGYRGNPTSYSNGSSYSNVSSSSDKGVPNNRSNVNGSGSAFGGMMGLFACCTYPANQTVGEQQPQPQKQQQVVQSQPTTTTPPLPHAQPQPTMSLPLKQSALVSQTEHNDILDHIFNGFENVVCHDSEDQLVGGTGADSKDPIIIVDDRDDNRILVAPTTQPPPTQPQSSSVLLRKSDNDILDNIFETFEGFVCREDMDTVEASLRVGARTTTTTKGNSTDNAPRTPAAAVASSQAATTPSTTATTTKAMTTTQPKRDILDSVFEGVEYAMCREGPPTESYTQNTTKRDNYYSAAARKGFVQTHRGDWRPKQQQPQQQQQQQQQGYSFERDNSIVSTSNGSSKLMEKNSYKFSRKLKTTKKNRQDMLDFVFDGVESMVCKDDELVGGRYNIQNMQSQFDEDLPNKRFHWEDE